MSKRREEELRLKAAVESIEEQVEPSSNTHNPSSFTLSPCYTRPLRPQWMSHEQEEGGGAAAQGGGGVDLTRTTLLYSHSVPATHAHSAHNG
jgi:hypothetical protein